MSKFIYLGSVKFWFTIILAISIMLFSCVKDKETANLSFYYWKTVFSISDYEKEFLEHNDVKTLFIRYFDVDMDDLGEMAYPVSPVKFDSKPDNFQVVPVIYIKNRVMLNKHVDLEDLSLKIISLTEQINKKNLIAANEIQIDCDWTIESRDTFMKFIEIFKKHYNKALSVTIRLHQVKYFYKTRVPAADYGVLMYYNMGNLAPDTINSVYDRMIAQKYLNSLPKYPMHLDVALPIFSRGVHIQNNRVKALINKISMQSFMGDSNYSVIGKNRVLVTNSHFNFGYYLMKNDIIKLEQVSDKDLIEMGRDLAKKLANKPKNIILFDLDSVNIKDYPYENKTFSKIISYF